MRKSCASLCKSCASPVQVIYLSYVNVMFKFSKWSKGTKLYILWDVALDWNVNLKIAVAKFKETPWPKNRSLTHYMRHNVVGFSWSGVINLVILSFIFTQIFCVQHHFHLARVSRLSSDIFFLCLLACELFSICHCVKLAKYDCFIVA